MATAESVKAKIQNLIDTANQTTGNEDTDLTTAVEALAEGYNVDGNQQTTKWRRPADWPNYDYINRSDIDEVFYSYDCRLLADNQRILRDVCLKTVVTSGKVLYQQGYIDENGFSATYSETIDSGAVFKRVLPSDAGNYVVYRVSAYSPNEHITSIRFERGDYGTNQYCVERWGRLPWLTELNGTNSLISDSIIDCINIKALYATWQNCSNLQTLDLSGWDVSNVTTLYATWQNCSNLQSLDLSGWDVSNVTTLSSTWQNCSNLQSLDLSGWDVNNVTTLNSAWSGCSNLQTLDLSGWDVSNVTTLGYTWQNCSNLQSLDLSGWDVSNVTTLSFTWQNCSNLQSLDLSGWDVNNVTTLNSAWSGCSNLQTLDLSGWDVSNVTTLYATWQNCSNLQTLDLSGWDVSNVTTLYATWQNCSNLQSLDLSGWDVSNVTTLSSTWKNCSNLIVYYPAVIYISYSFSYSHYLDAQSLTDIIDKLPTVTSAQTLSLSTASKGLLTDSQIITANEKGWTIA